MTEYGLPFDGLLTGDASKAPYSAAEWARAWKLIHGQGTSYPNYGVFKGSGDGSSEPLTVLADNPVSTAVKVQIGAALIDGRFYETTAIVSETINANVSGNARIDTVILRLDYTAQTVRLAVLQGTPAASPARPTLTQNASFWEIPLADIAVANGFATLAQSTITQRQRTLQGIPFGWQPYAYPIAYSHGVAPAASITLAANGGAAIIPFAIAGNILVQSISWRGAPGVGLNSSLGWDLYFEDTNDGLTAENTVRRVAQSNGVASGGSGGVANNFSLDAQTPVALSPGTYWLILQNRHATDSYGLAALAASGLAPNIGRTKTYSASGPGATAEVVTTTVAFTTSPAVRLNGRVFGEATVF